MPQSYRALACLLQFLYSYWHHKKSLINLDRQLEQISVCLIKPTCTHPGLHLPCIILYLETPDGAVGAAGRVCVRAPNDHNCAIVLGALL